MAEAYTTCDNLVLCKKCSASSHCAKPADYIEDGAECDMCGNVIIKKEVAA